MEVLQYVLFIQYQIQFQNNKVQALINFGSKINAMTLAYTIKLGFIIQKTSIRARKIDDLPPKTYGIASTRFLIQDSLEKVQFFKKTFLLANTNMEVVLGMLFLFFSNVNVKFTELKKLT